MSLPRHHSGYAHVEATGHALAVSSIALSVCAECDWASEPEDPVADALLTASLGPSGQPVIAEVDFDAWLAYGTEQGWVEGYCAMHGNMPMTDEETAYFNDGGDPCVPALRVWR